MGERNCVQLARGQFCIRRADQKEIRLVPLESHRLLYFFICHLALLAVTAITVDRTSVFSLKMAAETRQVHSLADGFHVIYKLFLVAVPAGALLAFGIIDLLLAFVIFVVAQAAVFLVRLHVAVVEKFIKSHRLMNGDIERFLTVTPTADDGTRFGTGPCDLRMAVDAIGVVQLHHFVFAAIGEPEEFLG
jgi:hypothetical protein